MMGGKCIVISDSFKGTLSSESICTIAKQSGEKILPSWEMITLPVADGGEGTVNCFLMSCGGQPVSIPVCGPFLGETVIATYALLPDGTAVIETAAAAGLPQVEHRKNPRTATTYGVGEQIRHAIEHGAKSIVLGLGGSATNDGGCGAAAALGVCFKNQEGKSFIPVGETLEQIKEIDISAARKLLDGIPFTAMCDINNPMHGKQGAAYIFGPQKGADPETVEFLDKQLKALDQSIQTCLGIHVSDMPGAGAAGAFGAGCVVFFHATLKSGIETVLDIIQFDELLKDCQLVITGEGQLDSQSLHGKVIDGVARRAKAHSVPTVALVGAIADETEAVYELGIRAVFSINRRAEDFSLSRTKSEDNYRRCLEDIFRLVGTFT